MAQVCLRPWRLEDSDDVAVMIDDEYLRPSGREQRPRQECRLGDGDAAGGGSSSCAGEDERRSEGATALDHTRIRVADWL
jgi:hypothetical protein